MNRKKFIFLKISNRIDHDDLSNNLNQWLTQFCQYIDSQDSLIADKVNILNKNMLKWMLYMLIRLAPDQSDDMVSDEAKRIVYENTPGPEQLEKMAISLQEEIGLFTSDLIK